MEQSVGKYLQLLSHTISISFILIAVLPQSFTPIYVAKRAWLTASIFFPIVSKH